MADQDRARLQAAMTRFRAFFQELRDSFMERGDVLAQIALALLGREHVLVAGPPGTAKSALASAVLGRIVCEQTGSPSFYARQITESTVQTDLIGPIDFKNLTETGRTTHFTDEGILGNVHAFLDEVFDGRDMLLRSALNLLQEREVKQGGTITKGRIECALMTSNRYISEILEQSRETLLAFIDRIAFVGFVPRGFADPAALGSVLRRNVGGLKHNRLDALLTIQDLDVLQAATDDVWVAPELCDSLAELLSMLDAELAAATRADPAFAPTRYISTRTAVRCGNLLRSATMFRRIFQDQNAAPQAAQTDFEMLRLHLLLSGPTPEQTAKLLEREVDPVEKRQLGIVRTEREIFDACLRKLPVAGALTQRPREVAKKPQVSAPSSKAAPAAAAAAAPPDPLTALELQLLSAQDAGDAQSLLTIARNAAELAREGAPDIDRARRILDRATRGASVIGMSVTLDAATAEKAPLQAVQGVVALARSLSDGSASMHSTARWMQERALELVADAALYSSSSYAQIVDATASESTDVDPMSLTNARLKTLMELADLRRLLLSEIASRAGTEPEDEGWRKAMDHAETMLAAWWSRSFALAMNRVGETNSLDKMLGALEPELLKLDDVDERLGAILGRDTGVKRRVAGARLTDVVKKALLAARGSDRMALVKQIRGLLDILARHELRGAVEIGAWLSWTASTLLSAEQSASAPTDPANTLEGYRSLRARGHRVAISCTLAEVALLVAGESGGGDKADEHQPATLLNVLPEEAARAVADADIGRIERALDYLETWFAAYESASTPDLVRSRFFELVWDEAALARFSMEARLIEELLPAAAERAKKLRWRLDALNERAHARGVTAVEESSEAIWASKAG